MAAAEPIAATNSLTARWLAGHDAGSTVVSGAGVWVLLAGLLGGAEGAAASELSSAVGLPAEDALDGMRAVLDVARESTAVRTALGIWTLEWIELEEDWVAAMPPDAIGALSGDPVADQAALDAWVSRSTGGVLAALPIKIDEATLMVLASALSVRTKWVRQFEAYPGTLRSGVWEGQPGVLLRNTTTDVDRVSVLDSSLTLLRVVGEDDVDVYLALGAVDASPGSVISGAIDALSADAVGTVGSTLELGTPGPGVTVAAAEAASPGDTLQMATVAFDVQAHHDLLQRAPLFGLTAACEVVPGHFPGISTTPLAVGEAAQDVTAQFTHEGFMAAAVTAFGMRAGSAAPMERFEVRRLSVTFDRPFGFVAVHRQSGLVLVAGWVATPAPPEPEPAES